METQSQADREPPDTHDGPTKTVYVLHGQAIASRSRRFAAMVIDSAILGLIVLMMFVAAVSGEDAQMPWEAAATLTVAFLIFYHILAWTAFSSTPGKMMLKLQIVDRNGWRIGILQSVGRLIGYGISTLFVGLGFAWTFVNRFGRGWHDYIAGTYVIYQGPGKSRSRNMAGDFFQDLMGGPPSKRDFADSGSAEAMHGRLAADDREQARQWVRVVDVDDATRTLEDRPVIGDYPVAEFSRRVIAFGLDIFASFVASLAALFVLSIWIPQTPDGFVGEDTARQDSIRLSIILALIFGYLVYPVISNWMFKSTAGKRIMHLQVVDRSGQNVGLSRLLTRHLCYFVSAPIVFVGFISVLFDDYSQSWHDKIARTYVTYAGDGRISRQRSARRPPTTGKGRLRSDWPTE